MSRIVPIAAVLLALMFGAGLNTGVVAADSGNQQNVTQNEDEAPGTQTGGATSGTPAADTSAFVHQINVQVAAGDPRALANSTQTASNQATVDQTATAATGDATASGGSSASSGNATATATAILLQMNIQVMALLSEDCVVNQAASNEAQVTQDATALSGDATAEGNSDAASGDARASALQVSLQRNLQVYVCTGRDPEALSGDQQAANTLGVAQEAGALSGDAAAAGGAEASGGDAEASASEMRRQANRQVAVE